MYSKRKIYACQIRKYTTAAEAGKINKVENITGIAEKKNYIEFTILN